MAYQNARAVDGNGGYISIIGNGTTQHRGQKNIALATNAVSPVVVPRSNVAVLDVW